MAPQIRKGVADDLPACVAILETVRARYQDYEPQFWKRSAKASPMSLAFLRHLTAQEGTLFLVAERDGGIVGFLTAKPQPVPPVFEPGKTAFVDDFYVAGDAEWPVAGISLLQEARTQLKAQGYEQIIVVTAHRDDAKMAALKAGNLSLASAWWVGTP
jgi:L-amino acid N-acyltransferase YncA